MDDDVELRRLRERVYGADGSSATPAMRERLDELENGVRRPAVAVDPPVPANTPAKPGGEGPHPTGPEHEVPNPAPTRRLRWTLAVVGAVALLGAGVAIGAAVTASAPAAADPAAATPDPAAALYPELTFRQTIEDAISADVLRDSGLASGSTRYIATVSDYLIYFAQPDDGDGRCIVTVTASDERPWSAACAPGAPEGAAVFRIDDGLTVTIGDPDEADVRGIPFRLSESVTAYVAQ